MKIFIVKLGTVTMLTLPTVGTLHKGRFRNRETDKMLDLKP